MLTAIKSKWLWFWQNHVQKTTAWIVGTLSGLDLVGYAGPIKGLVGEKKYYGIVVASALINAARAHMSKQSPPPPVA